MTKFAFASILSILVHLASATESWWRITSAYTGDASCGFSSIDFVEYESIPSDYCGPNQVCQYAGQTTLPVQNNYLYFQCVQTNNTFPEEGDVLFNGTDYVAVSRWTNPNCTLPQEVYFYPLNKCVYLSSSVSYWRLDGDSQSAILSVTNGTVDISFYRNSDCAWYSLVETFQNLFVPTGIDSCYTNAYGLNTNGFIFNTTHLGPTNTTIINTPQADSFGPTSTTLGLSIGLPTLVLVGITSCVFHRNRRAQLDKQSQRGKFTRS